jgi:hypothetical protein
MMERAPAGKEKAPQTTGGRSRRHSRHHEERTPLTAVSNNASPRYEFRPARCECPTDDFRDMVPSRNGDHPMGRQPLRKKGAMTAAERQRRRRKRVKAEQRSALRERQQAENHARYLASLENPPQWTRALSLPAQPPLESLADEIAWQIEEVLVADGVLTIDDVRAAIDRRFKKLRDRLQNVSRGGRFVRAETPACQNSRRMGARCRTRRYPEYRAKRESAARGTSAVPLMADASGPVTDTVSNVPEIGIGGRLTTPPLPHHLAYGSRTSAVRSG